MQEIPSHLNLLPSLLIAIVAAIPNHTLRYSCLGALVVVALLCTIHPRSLSVQFSRLADAIDQTDEQIRSAMAQCPRENFSLMEERGRLLE
jgi:hypothetical protein